MIAKEKQQSGNTVKKTVLVIDDESEILEIYREMLEMNGFEVLLSRNGQDGLMRFIEHQDKIDLIVLDMMMPEMCGDIALEKIREMDKDIKVIISTGFSEDEKFQKVRDLGITDMITKPHSYQTFISSVYKALETDSATIT